MAMTIAHFIATYALAMLMLSVGLRTDHPVLFELKARWKVIVRALLVVWLGVPALALLVLYLLKPSQVEAAALIVMAVSPGVPLVLRQSGKAHGDAKTSLLVLIATAITALIMVPIWAAAITHFTRLDLEISLRSVASVLLPTVIIPYVI